MPATSNIQSVEDFLDAVFRSLDCSDATTAKALAAPIREGIAARAGAQAGPDGVWAENRGKYGQIKSQNGIPVGTGLGDGSPRMLDTDQLTGEIKAAGPNGFTLVPGIDDAVKQRFQWFENGSNQGEDGTSPSGATNQPPRPLWGATDEDEAKVAEACLFVIFRKIGG